MRVEQARVEVEHGFADRSEAEVARLNDAGVDRADRYLKDALAFGDEVRKLIGGFNRNAPRSVESLAEREDARRPPVVNHERAGIGMPDGDDPEEIPHLALVPVCGRDCSRQGWHLRVRSIHGD